MKQIQLHLFQRQLYLLALNRTVTQLLMPNRILALLFCNSPSAGASGMEHCSFIWKSSLC